MKKLLIILGIVGVIAVAGFHTVSYFAEQKLSKLLGERVAYRDMHLSTFRGEISFGQATVQVDSADNGANVAIAAHAQRITIEGFSLWNLLISQKINVERLGIDSLELELELPALQVSNPEKKEINLFVKDLFTRIEVQHFEILHSDLVVRKIGSSDTLLWIGDINLSARGIMVDTATVHNIFPLEFHQSDIQIGNLFMKSGEDYTLTGQRMLVRDTTFSIETLRLSPNQAKTQFVQQHPYEKVRLDISVDGLTAHKLLWEFMEDHTLQIHSGMVLLERLSLLAFKDKTPPERPPEVRPLLTGLLRSLPFVVTLDTLQVKDGYIQYEQLPVVFPRAGKIFFDKFYLSAYNVTNDSSQIEVQPITKLDVFTSFMGRGELNTSIWLDMSSPTQAFSVSGRLGPIPMANLNQALAPLTGVEATGALHSMDFAFEGDTHHSEGMMDLEYSDLYIQVYDQNRDKIWLKSVFGNMMINGQNLRDDARYQEGQIHFVRYQNKGFFNFFWNSIRVALMDVALPLYTNPDLDTPPDSPKYLLDD